MSSSHDAELSQLPSLLPLASSCDIERGTATEAQPDVPEGFAAVADWMAQDRDTETFIYRKFDDLGARNLLYLQCELLVLRKKLIEYDRRAARVDADMNLKDAARTWEVLVEQCEAGNEDSEKFMKLIKELRLKVKEYRTHLRRGQQRLKAHDKMQKMLSSSRARLPS
jgi:hypothetical protein